MKIKLNSEILGVNEESLKDEDGLVITLRSICQSSLLAPDKDDTEKQKIEKYDVYKKVKGRVLEADLTIDELHLIKKCIGKFQSQLVVGQCFEFIEKGKLSEQE